MAFISSIGTLMVNTGLDDLLKAAFGGVEKMLSGKNFPQNFRALRIAVEELLREFITNYSNMEELQNFLATISSQNRTSNVWVNNLVRPVLYMMLYVRAELEGDWISHNMLLHGWFHISLLQAIQTMLD